MGCRSQNPQLRIGACSADSVCTTNSSVQPWARMRIEHTVLDQINIGVVSDYEKILDVLNATGPHDAIVLNLAGVHNLIHLSAPTYCVEIKKAAEAIRAAVSPRTVLIAETPTAVRIPLKANRDHDDMLSTRKHRRFLHCTRQAFEHVIDAFAVTRPRLFEVLDGFHYDNDGHALRALAAIRLHNMRHLMRATAEREAATGALPGGPYLVQRRR